VSFDVHEGEIFGLLGPNGAGKTTTVECLLGLREPDSGEIAICGIDARKHPQQVKERIGASLQTTSLQDRITPREALALYGAFYAKPASPDGLLQRFSLADKADVPFDTLSGGQRQRLALALAFVNSPDVVFLDEPTSGLDPHARRELHAEIAAMKRDGHTVLLTTHYLDEAETLCDRVAIIDHGRIIATGTPHALMARSSATEHIVVHTTPAPDMAWLRELPAVDQVTPTAEGAELHSTNATRTVAALMQLVESRGLALAELHVQKATLEDVFIELTGAAPRE
jgi:ABC-2 type transport system ATP-binding protein